jgi:hypothetical protein
MWWNSNDAKKLSWGGNTFLGGGGIFKRKNTDLGLYGKIRFNSKFSIDHNLYIENGKNGAGWADNLYGGNSPDTVIFARRNINSVENVLGMKYNFNNKMGLTLRARHYWSKVSPQEFFELDKDGNLQQPNSPYNGNRNQNYNFLSADLVYTWQFAQGSFITVVWKDISENFSRSFEKGYFKNVANTINLPQFSSLSVRVIYFLDYLTVRKKLAHHS